MSAGSIQLSAKGLQDEMFTGSPSMSYFKQKISKTLSFLIKSKEIPFFNSVISSSSFQQCQIKAHGDILRNITLKITFPELFTEGTGYSFPDISYIFRPSFSYMDSSYNILSTHSPTQITQYYNTIDTSWLPVDTCSLREDFKFSFVSNDARVVYIGFQTLEFANFWGFKNFINYKNGNYIFRFGAAEFPLPICGWVNSYSPYFRHYVPNAGVNFIKSIDLLIGGQQIESIPSEYLLIYNDISIPEHQQESINILNKNKRTRAVSDVEYYISIPFTTKNIPICALDRHDVKLQLTTNKMIDIIDPEAYNVTQFSNIAGLPERITSNTCIFDGTRVFTVSNSNIYSYTPFKTQPVFSNSLIGSTYNSSVFDGQHMYTCADPFIQRFNTRTNIVETFNYLNSGGFSSSNGLSIGCVSITNRCIQILNGSYFRNYDVPINNISNVFNTSLSTIIVNDRFIYEFKGLPIKYNQVYNQYPIPAGEIPISFTDSYFCTHLNNIYTFPGFELYNTFTNDIQIYSIYEFENTLYILTKDAKLYNLTDNGPIGVFTNKKIVRAVSWIINNIGLVILFIDQTGRFNIWEPIGGSITYTDTRSDNFYKYVYLSNDSQNIIVYGPLRCTVYRQVSGAGNGGLVTGVNVNNGTNITISPVLNDPVYITDDSTFFYLTSGERLERINFVSNPPSRDTTQYIQQLPRQASNLLGFDGTYVYVLPTNGGSNVFLYNTTLPFSSNSSYSYINLIDQNNSQFKMFAGTSSYDGAKLHIFPENASSNIVSIDPNQNSTISDLTTVFNVGNVTASVYINDAIYFCNKNGIMNKFLSKLRKPALGSYVPTGLNLDSSALFFKDKTLYATSPSSTGTQRTFIIDPSQITGTLRINTPSSDFGSSFKSYNSLQTIISGKFYNISIPYDSNRLDYQEIISQQNITTSTQPLNEKIFSKTSVLTNSNVYIFPCSVTTGKSNTIVVSTGSGVNFMKHLSNIISPSANFISSAVLGNYVILSDENSKIRRFTPSLDVFADDSGYTDEQISVFNMNSKMYQKGNGNVYLTSKSGNFVEMNVFTRGTRLVQTPVYTSFDPTREYYSYFSNVVYNNGDLSIPYLRGSTISSLTSNLANVYISYSNGNLFKYDLSSNDYYNTGFYQFNRRPSIQVNTNFIAGFRNNIYISNSHNANKLFYLTEKQIFDATTNFNEVSFTQTLNVAAIVTTTDQLYVCPNDIGRPIQRFNGTGSITPLPIVPNLSNIVATTTNNTLLCASKSSNLFVEFNQQNPILYSNISQSTNKYTIPFSGNTCSRIFRNSNDTIYIPYTSNTIFKYSTSQFNFDGTMNLKQSDLGSDRTMVSRMYSNSSSCTTIVEKDNNNTYYYNNLGDRQEIYKGAVNPGTYVSKVYIAAPFMHTDHRFFENFANKFYFPIDGFTSEEFVQYNNSSFQVSFSFRNSYISDNNKLLINKKNDGTKLQIYSPFSFFKEGIGALSFIVQFVDLPIPTEENSERFYSIITGGNWDLGINVSNSGVYRFYIIDPSRSINFTNAINVKNNAGVFYRFYIKLSKLSVLGMLNLQLITYEDLQNGNGYEKISFVSQVFNTDPADLKGFEIISIFEDTFLDFYKPGYYDFPARIAYLWDLRISHGDLDITYGYVNNEKPTNITDSNPDTIPPPVPWTHQNLPYFPTVGIPLLVTNKRIYFSSGLYYDRDLMTLDTINFIKDYAGKNGIYYNFHTALWKDYNDDTRVTCFTRDTPVLEGIPDNRLIDFYVDGSPGYPVEEDRGIFSSIIPGIHIWTNDTTNEYIIYPSHVNAGGQTVATYFPDTLTISSTFREITFNIIRACKTENTNLVGFYYIDSDGNIGFYNPIQDTRSRFDNITEIGSFIDIFYHNSHVFVLYTLSIVRIQDNSTFSATVNNVPSGIRLSSYFIDDLGNVEIFDTNGKTYKMNEESSQNVQEGLYNYLFQGKGVAPERAFFKFPNVHVFESVGRVVKYIPALSQQIFSRVYNRLPTRPLFSNASTYDGTNLWIFPGPGSTDSRALIFNIGNGGTSTVNSTPDIIGSLYFNGNVTSINTTALTYYSNPIRYQSLSPFSISEIYNYTQIENSYIVLNTNKGTYHVSNNQIDIFQSAFMSNICSSTLVHNTNVYFSNTTSIFYYNFRIPPLTRITNFPSFKYITSNTQGIIGFTDSSVRFINRFTLADLGTRNYPVTNSVLNDYYIDTSNVYVTLNNGRFYNLNRNLNIALSGIPTGTIAFNGSQFFITCRTVTDRISFDLRTKNTTTIPRTTGAVFSVPNTSNVYYMNDDRMTVFNPLNPPFYTFPTTLPGNVENIVNANGTLYMLPSGHGNSNIFTMSNPLIPPIGSEYPFVSNVSAAYYDSLSSNIWMITNVIPGSPNLVSLNTRTSSLFSTKLSVPRIQPAGKIRNILFLNNSVFYTYKDDNALTLQNNGIFRMYFRDFIDETYFENPYRFSINPSPIRKLVTDGQNIYTMSNIIYRFDSTLSSTVQRNTGLPPILRSNISGSTGYFDGRFVNILSNNHTVFDTNPLDEPSIASISSIVSYAYVDQDVKSKFQNNILDYVITQVQTIPKTKVPNIDSNYSFGFKGPVKEILFKTENGVIDSLSLFFNGQLKHNTGNNYISNIAFDTYHSRSPTNIKNLYSLSLCDDPESTDPTGYINMSRINEKIFNIKVSNINTDITAYALNYNVLRIRDGLAGTVFYDSI